MPTANVDRGFRAGSTASAVLPERGQSLNMKGGFLQSTYGDLPLCTTLITPNTSHGIFDSDQEDTRVWRFQIASSKMC